MLEASRFGCKKQLVSRFDSSLLPSVQDLLHSIGVACQNVCIRFELTHLPVALCDDELDLSRVPDHLALLLLLSSLFRLVLCVLDQLLVLLQISLCGVDGPGNLVNVLRVFETTQVEFTHFDVD